MGHQAAGAGCQDVCSSFPASKIRPQIFPGAAKGSATLRGQKPLQWSGKPELFTPASNVSVTESHANSTHFITLNGILNDTSSLGCLFVFKLIVFGHVTRVLLCWRPQQRSRTFCYRTAKAAQFSAYCVLLINHEVFILLCTLYMCSDNDVDVNHIIWRMQWHSIEISVCRLQELLH